MQDLIAFPENRELYCKAVHKIWKQDVAKNKVLPKKPKQKFTFSKNNDSEMNDLEHDSNIDNLSDDSVENRPIECNDKVYQSYMKNHGGYSTAINSAVNSPTHYATFDNFNATNKESFFRSPSPEYNKIRLSAVSQMLLNLK